VLPAPGDEADASDRVLAIDNVPLDLPVASAGTRSLAASLDYLLVGLANTLLVVAAFSIGIAIGLRSFWWLGALLFALFLLDYGYFAGFEIATHGQTPGKRAVGLRVVSRHGSRPSRTAFLLRNAVRNLDIVIGVPLMVLDPMSRRLGDRLAGTIVVRTRPGTATVLRRVPKDWTARQIEVLESFLERAAELEPEKSLRLAESLVAAIERDDPAFLPPETRGQPAVSRLRAAVARDPDAE
jgi:uncharacterized RDD family membrane protein YckC